MSVDLGTTYLGLKLKNPVVVSASPLSERLDVLKRLEDAGAAAAVLPSLFQEQIEHDELESHKLHAFGTESFAEALDYFPELDDYNTGPDRYLELIDSAKKAVSIPIIASLNGSSKGGWERFARQMEQAGADALELNVYFVPTDPDTEGVQVESQYLDLIAAVRAAVSLPLAVKIGPYFSSLPHMAKKMVEAGANGLVLFNRYLQPDLDPESLTVTPDLVLSTPHELRLPLRWTAILRGRIRASLAVTSGVHSARDVLKALLVGADVTMMASALLQRGPSHVRGVLTELNNWLTEFEYSSVEQMKGSMSQINSPDPSAFERSNYMKALISYTGPEV